MLDSANNLLPIDPRAFLSQTSSILMNGPRAPLRWLITGVIAGLMLGLGTAGWMALAVDDSVDPNMEIGAPVPESHALMKGVELYCWRESGAWFFSLVAGKNVGTDKEDVLAQKMRGSQGLKKKLRKLPEGTSVFLNPTSIPGIPLSKPPRNILKDLERVAAERKLDLEVGG